MNEQIIYNSFYSTFLKTKYKKLNNKIILKSFYDQAKRFFMGFHELSDMPKDQRCLVEKSVLKKELTEDQRLVDNSICTWEIVRSYIGSKQKELQEKKVLPKYYNLGKKDQNMLVIYYYYLITESSHKNTLTYLKWMINKDLCVWKDLPAIFHSMSDQKIKQHLAIRGIKFDKKGDIYV